jgi:hypothetical protein
MKAATTDQARALAAATTIEFAGRLLTAVGRVSPDRRGFAATNNAILGASAVAKSLASGDYAAASVRALALVDSLGLSRGLPEGTTRLVSFAGDIAQAESAESVDQTLDHYVGRTTFIEKRTPGSGWHVFVNAYVGGAAGREDACRGASACADHGRFAGAYAPVGLEVGHVVDWRGLSWLVRSAGVFVQAVDLGTLASWRWSHADTVSAAPTVSARQIFSPGAHAVFGLRDLPISVGFGGALAPRLRKVRTGGVDEELNAVRPFSAFVAVDIPLVP